MKTIQNAIELELTPLMSIKNLQEKCQESIHAIPAIYRKGEKLASNTILSEIGIVETHKISIKPTGDVSDIIQSFEKVVKNSKVHMFFYYEQRPWAIMLGDVKIKDATKLPSLIKSWFISIAIKLAIKYAD